MKCSNNTRFCEHIVCKRNLSDNVQLTTQFSSTDANQYDGH